MKKIPVVIAGALLALAGAVAADGLSFNPALINNPSLAGSGCWDSPTLCVDATNNRVGIGDATPSSDLSIERDVATVGPAAQVLNPNTQGAPAFIVAEDEVNKFGAIQYIGSAFAVGGPWTPASVAVYAYSGATGGLGLRADTNAPIKFWTAVTERGEFQGDGDFAVDTDTLFVDAVNDQVFVNASADPFAAGQVHLYVNSNATQTQGNFLLSGTSAADFKRATSAAADKKIWQEVVTTAGDWALRTLTDAGGAGKDAISIVRGATTAISSIAIGNATDNPTVTVNGTTSDGALTVNGTGVMSLYSAQPIQHYYESDQAANEKRWTFRATGKAFQIRASDDGFTSGKDAVVITRGTGTAISSIALGNATDNPTVTINGATLRAVVNVTSAAAYDPASLVANSSRCDSVTTNSGITTTGGSVSWEPGAVTPFDNGCVVTSVRATAADTVEVCWRNTINAVTACNVGSSTWKFSQAQ